ncbi:MAG TPA: PGF-pre-PGF domain-containing protein, partial [Methanosarcina sp.]|nr:PGF-pre-PGF domain-containing protein [Methanosarcina sp.]
TDTGNSGTKDSNIVSLNSGNSDTHSSDNTSSDTKSSGNTSSDTESADNSSSDTGDEDSNSSDDSGMDLVSSEPATNIAVKELSTRSIVSDYPIQFDFTKNATCIVNIEFNPKKTFRKTTTVVEELKNRSTLVPTSPEGTVYKYVNIWVGDSGAGLPTSIKSGFVEFKVEKAWIKDNNISKAQVVLQRYDSNWQPLYTEKVGEDENYIYFKSETPGYSFFAITEYTGQNIMKVSGAGKIQETLRNLGSEGKTALYGNAGNGNSRIKNPMGTARILMAISLPLFMILVGYGIFKKKI